MKTFLLLFFITASMCCCNNSGTTPAQSPTDTVAHPLSTEELRQQRPEFPGYREQQLALGDSIRYLRIVLNNNILAKTWMVYFDQPKNKWVTLTWTGKGENSKVLVDTTFKEFIGINNAYEDRPGFYFATSADNGTTWQPLDMSLAPLAACKHPNLRTRKMAQLIVSNDFFNAGKLPTLAYIWQWNYDPMLSGQGPAATWDFSRLCDAAQEIEIKVKK